MTKTSGPSTKDRNENFHRGFFKVGICGDETRTNKTPKTEFSYLKYFCF